MSDLPRWQCHKQVSADKIVRVEVGLWHLASGFVVLLTPALIARVPVGTSPVGGYFVRYDGDSFESWSPGQAFEDGYTRLPA